MSLRPASLSPLSLAGPSIIPGLLCSLCPFPACSATELASCPLQVTAAWGDSGQEEQAEKSGSHPANGQGRVGTLAASSPQLRDHSTCSCVISLSYLPIQPSFPSGEQANPKS